MIAISLKHKAAIKLINCYRIYNNRVTFKVVADRMVPYRLVLTQMILVISVLIYGVIWQLKQGFSVMRLLSTDTLPSTQLPAIDKFVLV